MKKLNKQAGLFSWPDLREGRCTRWFLIAWHFLKWCPWTHFLFSISQLWYVMPSYFKETEKFVGRKVHSHQKELGNKKGKLKKNCLIFFFFVFYFKELHQRKKKKDFFFPYHFAKWPHGTVCKSLKDWTDNIC